jgi:pimeloyl-ACP methyl ester carboxylesterase
MAKNSLVQLNLITALLFCSYNIFAQTEQGKKPDQYFISFDGVKIHYEVSGDGFPVLLVHGFISDGQSWKKAEVFNDLIKAGYKVIVPDMRGNGKSDKPHTPEAYLKDAEARDLIGLMTALKIDSYHVVGYSRGSIITSRLLVMDSRINKAVLGGMGADFTDPEWPRRKMFYRALMGEPVPELEAMVKRVQDSGLDQLALAYLQNGQPSTSHEELGKIKQPVLVISGDRDNDNGSAEALAALIKTAQPVRVPGDHGSTRTSKEFSVEVIKFLGLK